MHVTDWDDAYDNFGHIPEAAAYPPRWGERASAFRETLLAENRARLDIAYGGEERERLDLFLPEVEPKGLSVFIHGGYWRAFDKSMWSHLAAGALARGWAVAMPSYTLAPQARISRITRQAGAAVTRAAAEIEGPVRLSGHSAGGHLAARMVCADSPLDADVRARIEHVVSISGVHDLRPLMRTKLNDLLRLDLAESRAESPALLEPLDGVSLTCWAGAAERPEFVRQNALLANVWAGLGADTECIAIEGEHHFNVIDALADPDSELTGRLAP
ncbi:MAG: alpha/beta hydrolase [Phyllobacteriaceae bacterium]|nr:alpha/beta hydrolase [Phyllobacteriaceae bacterium]MBA90961.1 alpha/beta hydrolase [Phyllobacteriaceae bacterium]